MSGVFDAGSKDRILEPILAAREPQRIRIRIDGPLRVFGDAVNLRIADGRLLDARIGKREGARALAILALVEAGQVEVTPDQTESARVGPIFKSLWAEARGDATGLRAELARVGGLDAVLRRAGPEDPGLPEAANEVLALVDGRRNIAGLLAASRLEPLLSGRILARLHDLGALAIQSQAGPAPAHAPALAPISAPPASVPPLAHSSIPPVWTPPDSGWGQSSVLPSDEELEGDEAQAQVQAWLTPAAAQPLVTGDAFRSVFIEDQVKSGGPGPAHPRPPSRPPIAGDPSAGDPSAPPERRHVVAARPASEPPRALRDKPAPPTPLDTFGRPIRPAHELDEEEAAAEDSLPDPDHDEAVKEAGMSRVPTVVFIAAGAALGLLLLVLTFSSSSVVVSPPHNPPPPVVPPAPPARSDSATTAGIAPLVVEGERPAIAGPDSPPEVHRAEALLNAGKYAEAESMLKDLRSTRPEDAVVFVLSGQLFVDTGRLTGADEMAEEAIARDPRFYRAWVLKGSVLQFRGQGQAAVGAYEKALAIDPKHAMNAEIQSVVEGLKAR